MSREEALLADLRAQFDRGYAEAPPEPEGDHEDVLDVRVGERPYALRLSELAALWADKVVTPLPGPVSSQRGLAASRGALVPVYDLAQLLGHARPVEARWLAVLARPALGLAFDHLHRHLRQPRTTLAPVGAGAARPFVRELIVLDDGPRPIIHLPSVVDAIRAQVQQRR